MTFRMPPEWAPHERCWMAWPCREGLWADSHETRKNYADVAHAIRDYEPLTMLVSPSLVDVARNYLGSDIDLFEVTIDDSWTRDSGPTFVVNDKGQTAGVSFGFNAWGGKYSPFDQDALMAERILERAGLPCIKSDLIAEGGGICVDGEGTLLTTDTCFPNANRNPNWSRDQIEEELKSRLGVSNVVWLPGDPLDDETDGHIDGIATFAAPGKVIIESTGDADDPRKPYFDQLRRTMESAVDTNGNSFELLELPEAREACVRGERFCMSYVNFYMANGALIAPSYGIDADDAVRERLQSYFPNRDIVMLRIDHVAEGGGGIHCITQQQPKI